jgi:hypothetical protein
MRHFKTSAWPIILSLLVLVSVYACEQESAATSTARMTPSGDGIEIEYRAETGVTSKELIPVHKSGTIRYFSAGVGIEERAAQYPSFPIKLTLVAGEKAYVSRVAITLTDPEGVVRLQIPPEQVNGPWVFIDLPPARYTVTAVRDNETIQKVLEVPSSGTTTVILRWDR